MFDACSNSNKVKSKYDLIMIVSILSIVVFFILLVISIWVGLQSVLSLAEILVIILLCVISLICIIVTLIFNSRYLSSNKKNKVVIFSLANDCIIFLMLIGFLMTFSYYVYINDVNVNSLLFISLISMMLILGRIIIISDDLL